jgi:hypothetical protein
MLVINFLQTSLTSVSGILLTTLARHLMAFPTRFTFLFKWLCTLDISGTIIELSNENLDDLFDSFVVEIVVGLEEFLAEIVSSHESVISIIAF